SGRRCGPRQATAARVFPTPASALPTPPSHAITRRRSPQLLEVVSEPMRGPGLGPRRSDDRQVGVAVYAVTGGLEALDQIDVLPGGHRTKAADTPVSLIAESHVGSMDVVVVAVRF